MFLYAKVVKFYRKSLAESGQVYINNVAKISYHILMRVLSVYKE